MSSYGNYGNNPYGAAPNAEAGYGYGQPEQHEMQSYGQPNPYGQPSPYGGDQTQPGAAAAGGAPQTGGHALSQQDFLGRVSHVRSEINALTADVQQIANLHSRALAGSDPAAQQQLETVVAGSQLRNTGIRDQIRQLKTDVERTQDSSRGLKSRQFEALNNEFKKELQGYLQEEQAYKDRYRDQIARQYRIVNPDASEHEIRQAADADWGNEGIFQTALRENRTGQASAVLGAVRARHNELVKIEQSIIELANMFQDLDTLVIQQAPAIERAEDQTERTNQHLDEGTKQVGEATKLAKHRRKLKWWCFFVVVLIIVAIALGVGLGYGLVKSQEGQK